MRRLAVTVLLLCTLPACRARVDIAIDMAGDGSGEVALATGLDRGARKLLERQSGDPVAALRGQAGGTPTPAPPGGREEPWRRDGFEGWRFVTPFSGIAELEEFFNAPGASPLVEAERRGDQLSLTVDLPVLAAAVTGELALRVAGDPRLGGVEAGDLAPHLEYRMTVHVRGRVLDHNADDVEADGTLVWHLLPVPDTPARLRADLTTEGTGTSPKTFALGTLAVVCGIALARTLRRARSRRAAATVAGPRGRCEDAAASHGRGRKGRSDAA